MNPELWPIHTVVFDLDDTLFREADYVASGFCAVDDWLVKARKTRGFLSAAQTLFAAGRRGRIFDEALAQLGCPAAPELIADMVGAYRDHTPVLKPLPDAIDCLQWVQRECRAALLTDGYHGVQRRKVAALGIEHYFQCVVYTDAMGRAHWKPAPAGFLRIMQELPGAPAGYVYVADNPNKDFIAPRALGWKSIRLRRVGGEHATIGPREGAAADREIGSLAELRRLIQPSTPSPAAAASPRT